MLVNPELTNLEISQDEFLRFVDNSDAWRYLYKTSHRYNLHSGQTKDCRDPFVKEALKEYDLSTYYDCCDKNKTPRAGRMFRSLTGYCHPLASPPRRKDRRFWECFSQAKNQVFRNFDTVKPISVEDAIRVMPKNTSAGFNGLEFTGDSTRKKKEDILPFIKKRYHENFYRIQKNIPVNDYCIFAMRGHLSSRLDSKTRPIWLVSASTIVAELKYYQPFYTQINEKPFFRDMWITGTGSLPRLNRYLRRHPDLYFYNTDISQWDSYRAAWCHEDIMKELGRKIDMHPMEKKEFKYCIDSAIRTKVLFPNGEVHQKYAGIISGTAGTLLFNSLLNTIAGLTIMLLMKMFSFDIEDDFYNKCLDLNWLGDDFAFYYRGSGRFDLDKFSKLMFDYFNVLIKPEKTVIADNLDDRKYLGYQLKGGFLFRTEKELFQSLLYCERPFPSSDPSSLAISFSRFFSYLLLGGINNYKFLEFFYFYMGKYENLFLKLHSLYQPGMDNIFKLLKDVWNVKIPNFTLDTFRKMHLELLKYALLYGYDLKFSDLIIE